jgi:hypothetical protein
MVYIMGGLNAADQGAMDPDRVVHYERIHRAAAPIMMLYQGKPLLYAGSSGYWQDLFPVAIARVAEHAAILDRAITGVVPAWDSPPDSRTRSGPRRLVYP